MSFAVTIRPVHAAPSPRRLSPRPRRMSSSTLLVASAKRLRRRRRRRTTPLEDDTGVPSEEETQDAGTSELEFLAALASEPTPSKQDGQPRSSPPPRPPPSSPSGAGRRAPLRGLDVLQALQHKAAAGRKGSGKAGGKGQRRGAKGSVGAVEEPSDVRDYSNVRPLDIKSDWEARLNELDKLIQDLQAQQHHYAD